MLRHWLTTEDTFLLFEAPLIPTCSLIAGDFSFLPLSWCRPTLDLIGAMETQSEPSEMELDDVVITNPHIEAILENEDWIEDASYVRPAGMLD